MNETLPIPTRQRRWTLDSDAHRLAGVAALFVLYLGLWVIYGTGDFSWSSFLTAAATLFFVTWAAKNSGALFRTFFLLLAVGLVFDSVVEATYGLPDLIVAGAPAWMLAKLAGLFFWMCAWGLLALDLFRKDRASPMVHTLSLVPLLGLTAAYIFFYLGQTLNFAEVDHRFHLVLAGFNLLGILACLLCVSLGVGKPFVLMISGFAIFASSDFVYLNPEIVGQSELAGLMDPVWTLGRFVMLGGALTLPQLGAGQDKGALDPNLGARSGLSGLLIVFSFGLVLAVGAIEAVASEPILEAFLFVIACVAFVIIVAQAAKHFDDAVEFLGDWVRDLTEHRLETSDWRAKETAVTTTLRVTHLDMLLDSISESVARLRNNVIFLGPERLYRHYEHRPRSGPKRCFLVMPFGQPWSDEVHSTIRSVCESRGVQAVRGDDIFTPTDILEDIWQGINGSDFIVADITGRNPNVLYELGIAHTLGKPVLILTQSADDVPIDLGTRRMLIYGEAAGGGLREKLENGIQEVLNEYGWDSEA